MINILLRKAGFYFAWCKTTILSNKLIIINSFIMGILMILPVLLFPIVLGNSYRGINAADHGLDELWYSARGKEVLEGHQLGNPLLHEGKDAGDPQFSLSEKILLTPLRWIGGKNWSILKVYATYNFIGVSILLLLIYRLSVVLFGDKRFALITAILVIGGPPFLIFHQWFSTNVYSRAISPYIPLLVFFSYLNLLLGALRKTRMDITIVLSSLFFGLSFYIYFYAWSFIFVFNGVLFLLYFFAKEWINFKKMVAITIGGITLGSFQIFHLFHTIFLNAHTEFSKLRGYFLYWIEYTHAPSWNGPALVTLILFISFLYLRWVKKISTNISKNDLIFISGLVLSGWIVINQQVITGISNMPAHYIAHFIVPITIIIGGYFIWRLIHKENYRKFLFGIVFILVYFNLILGQYRASLDLLAMKQNWQNYRPIFDYLNGEAPNHVILAADYHDAWLFPIYTSQDLFWAYGFGATNIPLQKYKDAFFTYLYLNRFARNDVNGYLQKLLTKPSLLGIYNNPTWYYSGLYMALEGYWSGFNLNDYMKRFAEGDDQTILQERQRLIPELVKEYQVAVKKTGGIKNLLTKYQVRYIVWDKNKNPEWDLSFIPKEELVSSNNIILYRVQ